MNILSLLAIGASLPDATTKPLHMNPVQLFMDADIVVQMVMGGLMMASIWVLTIIISFPLRMGRLQRACEAYEADFWKARDLDAFQAERGRGDVPSARVVGAALNEWRRSLAGKAMDREGTRQRLASVMETVVISETDALGDRLNFLATIGSAGTFIGLFGTVWGIMSSFFQIGQAQNTSLAVVAPGIAEALAATAVGLLAAIPAVIAYNRFSHRVNAFEGRLQRFADRFHVSLSRELEGL